MIWGDDHHNALGLLRMLGRSGYNVFFLVHKIDNNIATVSKYCTNFVVVGSIQDGLNYLLNELADAKNKAVLLFTADKFSEAANDYLNELSEFYFVSGPQTQSVLSSLDDKYNMGLLAHECGFSIPKTNLYPSQFKLEQTDFPVIVKPCNPAKKDFKTRVVYNQRELDKVLSKTISGNRYVVQKYVPKNADGLIYGFRTPNGEIFLSGICVRNRWSDDGCGSYGFITSELPNDITISHFEKFFDKINFHGLFSAEFALTESKSYFYEFNFRNDGTSVLFFNAGANPVLSYVNSCFGIKDDSISKCVKPGKQYLMNEFWDVFNVVDRKLSYSQWKDQRANATIFFYYDTDDMRPYLIQKKLTISRFIKRTISKSWINKVRLALRSEVTR